MQYKYFVRGIVLLADLFVIALARIFTYEAKRGVALIRLDAIGDFILWTDSAKEYRKIYDGKHITLIANSNWVNAAIKFDYWHEVWPIEVNKLRTSLWYRWRILYKVSNHGFEVAIHPTYSRVLMHGDSIVRATRAGSRLGSVGEPSSDKRISDTWYTVLIPAKTGQLMELDRNAEIISYLSKGKYQNASKPLWPHREKLSPTLTQTDEYVIFFPGASWHGRRWPILSFSELAKRLNDKHRVKVVLCGSASEYEICQKIADSGSFYCSNLAGKTTLIELAELLRNAKLLVTNETSAAHLASSVNTPCVCITGGGHYGRFMPYPDHIDGMKPLVAVEMMECFNCDWKCTKNYSGTGPVPCISGVDVNQVESLTKSILNRP